MVLTYGTSCTRTCFDVVSSEISIAITTYTGQEDHQISNNTLAYHLTKRAMFEAPHSKLTLKVFYQNH